MERQRLRTTVVLWCAGACLAVLFLALLLVSGMRRRLALKTVGVEADIERIETANLGRTVAERVLDEQARKKTLNEEWARYSSLIYAWKPVHTGESGVVEGAEAARIDFKVALFDARKRVSEAAKAAKADVPADIGISENIETDKNPAMLFSQLAAAERLIGLALEQGIPEITRVRPLDPVVTPAEGDDGVEITQFPVRLGFTCSLNQFRQLLATVAGADHFFTITNLRIERRSVEERDRFDAEIVFNAIVMREPGGEVRQPADEYPGGR